MRGSFFLFPYNDIYIYIYITIMIGQLFNDYIEYLPYEKM